MAIACDLTISFGAAGNSLAYLDGGWALPEPDFTWAIGTESHIVLPLPEVADEYVLTLDAVPFVHVPEVPAQRLLVAVNDTVVGASTLARPTLLGYRIAGGMIDLADRVRITLHHPDAACPRDFVATNDGRRLSFALLEAKLYRLSAAEFRPDDGLPPGLLLGPANDRGFAGRSHLELTEWATTRTGLPISQLALKFESLGENCEFGLFQRACDIEPLGLLRFSSTFMRNLIRGIDRRFEGLGATDDIEPRLEGRPPREYMIHERAFGLVYHTFVYEGQRSAWLMREQEAARLKFLRRKFIEELEMAEKIFVYKRGAAVSDAEVLPLHMALNRCGDNTLLWVVPAEAGRPAGTVEVVMAGLLKGYIGRFAPDDNAHDFCFDDWLQICANACVLDRLRKPGPMR